VKKEYKFSELEELKNPYPGKKKAVGIHLSPQVVDYFKGLGDETGIAYQKLGRRSEVLTCFAASELIGARRRIG
jgi:hypothetical protein